MCVFGSVGLFWGWLGFFCLYLVLVLSSSRAHHAFQQCYALLGGMLLSEVT